VRVLLISTYELGHQPLHLASPAAAMEAAGHRVRCIDLSVEQLDRDKIGWAEAVGVSVPMHTAMRLAIGAGEQIRAIRPRLPICFYGLYAAVSDDPTIGGLVDRLIAGEYESELVEWVEALGDSPALRPATSSIDLGRHEPSSAMRGWSAMARSSSRGTSRPATAACTSAGTECVASSRSRLGVPPLCGQNCWPQGQLEESLLRRVGSLRHLVTDRQPSCRARGS
jgi:hypothetical protein